MELGKQVIHPGQIDVVQSAFTPSPQSIEWAEELIELFNKHQLSGKVCHYGLGFTINNFTHYKPNGRCISLQIFCYA